MPIRRGLPALLERGSRYGYQIRVEFRESTGGTWPLNIGPVCTTLNRLERDGLVRALPEGEGGQRPYKMTDHGRAEPALWFATPIARAHRPHDELAIQLALAVTTPGVDVHSVLQAQRSAAMRALQEHTRLKKTDGELPWMLVLDAMTYRSEAEIRWLDHCESVLVRYAPSKAKLAMTGTSLDEKVRQYDRA